MSANFEKENKELKRQISILENEINDLKKIAFFESYNNAFIYERFYAVGNEIRYLRTYDPGSSFTTVSCYNKDDGIVRESEQKIVIVFDIEQAVADDRVKIYVDGVQLTLSVDTGDDGSIQNTANYALGKRGNAASYNGRMSNVVFTETAWTEAEIDDYQDGILDDTGVALYRMNESDPGSPWTDATVDSSGNDNHGTPVGIDGATFFNQS